MNPYFYHGLDSMPFAHTFGFLLFWPVLVALAAWSVLIKGFALWHAARNGQKEWFIFLLIVNALGIPELIYLIWFRTDTQETAVAPAPVAAPATPPVSET